MPDEVAQAPAAEAPAAEPSAPEPAAPAGAKPKPGTPELARWHGQRAQAAIAKADAERVAEETGEAPAGTPPKDPKTGRFLKQPKDKTRADAGPSGPHKPATSGATPEPATKPKPDGAVPDSLAAVRRLASEGKLEEAFQRAFGRTPEELLNSKAWAAWRAESKDLRTKTEAKARETEQKEAQLRQLHQELAAEFKPLHDARKALAEGDLDKAFQLFAGTDFNTFSRNYLRQSTSPNVGKDPAVLELRKQLEETQREIREYRQREEEQTKTQRQAQAQREYVENMVRELEASDDPRIARAAKRTAFQRKVLEIQREHYDAATDWTIPHSEAAQLAIEALESEYGEWNEVFGGSASKPEPRGETRTPPARAATPARPTGKPVTTLSQKEAAEAATEPKLRGRALLEKWTQKAVAAQFKQSIG